VQIALIWRGDAENLDVHMGAMLLLAATATCPYVATAPAATAPGPARPRRRAPIVETLKKARRGIGVSREPAKLGSQDNSPRQGKDKPPATAADSAEHTRPTILS